MNFTTKNVLITGGSAGIGLATAKAFIDAGAKVWITGRNSQSLAAAAAEINSPALKTIVSDTSNLADIAILEQAIAKENIQLDVLFLNVGIASFATIAEATEESFDAQFNTNVKGNFFTLQKLIPHLADGSSVIFTNSTVSIASNMSASVYAATKGALLKIAQIAANELAPRKIRVNSVSPGPTATAGLPEESRAFLAPLTSLQRVADPSEIAKAVLFLASDSASYVTGTELLVDGGYINHALK